MCEKTNFRNFRLSLLLFHFQRILNTFSYELYHQIAHFLVILNTFITIQMPSGLSKVYKCVWARNETPYLSLIRMILAFSSVAGFGIVSLRAHIFWFVL